MDNVLKHHRYPTTFMYSSEYSVVLMKIEAACLQKDMALLKVFR